MHLKPTVIIMLLILASAGGLGIWKIITSSGLSFSNNMHVRHNDQIDTQNLHSTASNTQTNSASENERSTFVALFRQIKQQLRQENNTQAIETVNEQYSQLSSDQLSAFKQLFIRQGQNYNDNGQHNKALRFFSALSGLFNDVDVLDLLSSTAVKLSEWQIAFEALLRSSLLESRPDFLVKKQTALANIASQLKQSYLASQDYSSVQQLYQMLYEAHPGYAYFQYELGLAQLSLGDTITAKSQFNAIQYDLDIGPAAQEQLALLKQTENQQKTNEQQEQPRSNDIVVPLTRVGNSFLVSSSINGRQTQLLLDTGASITALSPSLIERLNLPATGEVIRLSTANGITEARLYHAKRIQLGRVIARDLVIAEIELGNTERFQGLLGTDLLNQINGNYLIDNQNNNLIFRSSNR